MEKTYTVMMFDKKTSHSKANWKITESGAKIIWKAYTGVWGHSQTIDRREERGGFIWDTEIAHLIEIGNLPQDFDWQKYILTT